MKFIFSQSSCLVLIADLFYAPSMREKESSKVKYTRRSLSFYFGAAIQVCVSNGIYKRKTKYVFCGKLEFTCGYVKPASSNTS